MNLNSIRSLAAAGALAAALFAAPASAVTVYPDQNINTATDVTVTLPIGSATPLEVPFAVTLSRTFTGSGTVNDIYAFEVDAAANPDNGGGLTVTLNAISGFVEGSLKLLFGEYSGPVSSPNGGVVNADNSGSFNFGTALNIAPSAPGQFFFLTLPNLVAGTTYAFYFEGDRLGSVNAKYDLAFSAAAVPVPPAIALLGGALVGLGALSRRRKQKASAEFA